MPAWTAACAPLTSSTSAEAGIETLIIPMFFCRGAWVAAPTTDSPKASVFDVPSMTLLRLYDCCQAKSPVVGAAAKLGRLVLPLARVNWFVVAPRLQK